MTKDLRKYASQTNVQLGIGALVLLFTVGIGLIWYFYGNTAAVLAFLCMLGAFVPIGLVWLFLIGLDKIVAHLNKD